ncbi:uncharacterized protein CcaverHIS019_0101380 [Cutaneotrichosporon cavernicola]|uniref:DNA mismatch repair protein MSH2 n=1 Tax=Cutaneotrichosporon cavernicola TaxID=279322 RepID=A0AA48I5I1_9TREE|nr:uncharacterized protein CcaverHIS019_0101380 [Cutaneotrichosporon cavernicola]BEI87420.1 hypothetical protein CcaverHIS019_0101380 [Cutaneotrichosporon cavernicola]BEI95188.1 hypothetical protein CcaverHIS631_0101370 [Cutaneotrichosporon cavernicola]BEJ02962.1 hypothetical protein CcaverHIS641_0101370 [Cutaneotrichosporon cavernicola]
MPMYEKELATAKPQFDDMDKDAEDRFCRFVEKLGPRSDGLVRLFDRGEFFSAHGPDALLIADQVYKTTNVLKYLGSRKAASSNTRGLPSVTISMTLAKAFLRDCLTSKQMRVEIYEPEEGARAKNNARWQLAKVASPGNISQLEDLLFASEDLLSNAVSMALRIQIRDGQRTVGAAFVDVQEKTIGVAEYAEDENFGNTESFLIQLGIKECVVQADDKRADHELSKLRMLIERCGVIVTERKASEFQAGSVQQDLGRLLDETHPTSLPEYDLKVAMSALAALISYLGLMSDSPMHGQFRLHHHDLSQYMKLDASAVKALNLMPTPELGGNKNMSLYGLLNRCKTSQGQRLLGRWLKQPLVNLHSIQERQNIVEMFVNDDITRRVLQDEHLRVMPDFHRICKKFHRGVATLEDIVRVYQAVEKLPRVIESLEKVQTENPVYGTLLNTAYINELNDHLEKLEKFSEMVENTIDLDDLANHNYTLQPSLDSELERIRGDLVDVRDQLDAEHRRVGADLGVDIDKKLHLENHHVYKYSFRITKAEASLLRGKKQFIELSTQKSGTIFTTATLREASDDFARLQEEYEAKQRHLVKEVVGIASSYTPVLELLDNIIAAIDVTVSLAHVSSHAPVPYVKPVMKERGGGDVVVRGARHPCLEVQDDIQFISNDHEMRKGSSEFQILTGPNMGGKSTYIREIGVIALMAQLGCFVPADSAELPIFDCILARVGAGDSQLKGVSTFMAEMLETATILRSATRDSLIIIDELGRGTSTYDGFGLAWAISEHIASQIRCFCLFATHFHELTTLADHIRWVKNLQVRAEVQPAAAGSKQDRQITLLYQVIDGHSDQSFGIHVAELARFPEPVVRLAKRKAEELEDFGEGDASPAAKLPKEEVDAGTEIVHSFLDEWRRRAEGGDGEVQLAALRAAVDEYKDKFEGNAWITNVLGSLHLSSSGRIFTHENAPTFPSLFTMFAQLLTGALFATVTNAQVTATGTMGVTNPSAAVMGTPINQTSEARLLSLNSINDFCIFGPLLPNSVVGDTEEEQVAWCVQPRNNARVIPDGTIHSAHLVKTPRYWQIQGYGDFTRMNIAAGDNGGELDPHGAKGTGNPIGGNVTSNATGTDVSYEEWMNFMSFNTFCLRICIAEEGAYTAEQQCQHEIDLMGCEWVMPGDYTNNSFTECQADSAYPPGWFPQPDGSVSTFHQRYTGTNSPDGALWTIGVTVTPPAPFSTPASSQCTTFSSIGNGIPPESLNRDAAFTWSGSLPATGGGSPAAATGSNSGGQASASAGVDAASAGQGSDQAKSAAGPGYVIAGASLAAMLIGVAAVAL